MATSIRLFRGAFGHVSVLNVESDFVTHAHPEAHIIVWIEGAAGRMTIGDGAVHLGAGMAAAINPLEPHSHDLACEGRAGLFLAFYIDQAWARQRRGLSSGAPLFVEPTIPLEPWLHRAAASLLDQLCDDYGLDDLAPYEIERLIDSLFDAADEAHPRRLRGLAANAMLDHRIRKAIELMKGNVCERMSLDDVAREVGLSRPHFFALFKEQTSLTPNVYWNTLRMDEALRQLRSTQEPLISVACHLGFTTAGNFSRFFRDHAGVPPTLYREAARAGL